MPQIVCIDEGTSKLDTETDEHIQQVIRSVFRNKTVLIIAHRVQSVRDCDRYVCIVPFYCNVSYRTVVVANKTNCVCVRVCLCVCVTGSDKAIHPLHSRVLVLSEGEVVESGSPWELLSDKASHFHSIFQSQ